MTLEDFKQQLEGEYEVNLASNSSTRTKLFGTLCLGEGFGMYFTVKVDDQQILCTESYSSAVQKYFKETFGAAREERK